MAKTILVTGNLGYIGSVLTRKLLDKGYSVIGYDKGLFSTPLVEEHVKGCEQIIDDISNFSLYKFKPDYILHLAAVSNDPSAELSEDDTFRINTKATSDIAAYCKVHDIPLIYASTASVYGCVEWELSNESDTKLNPISIYGKSKLAAEKRIREILGDDAIIFRQATVYGWSPRMRYDLVVNTFLSHAIRKGKVITVRGAGEVWRPLVEVGDVADAYVTVIDSGKTYSPTMNLVHKSYRIQELASWMQYILKDKIKFDVEIDREGEVDRRNYAISGKLAAENGITCPTGITPSLHEMLQHIQQGECSDFENPIYYNHRWLTILMDVKERLSRFDKVP
jgi:nucleoside-diphosphate-sugar epimerase